MWTGEKTPKRKRLLMKHSGEDKGDISLQEHFITNLLEEYNSHCGDEYGKNVCIYTSYGFSNESF